MRAAETDLLVLPGLGDSGPDHWQSRWEGRLSTARRVAQADWTAPRRADWTGRIVEAVKAANRPVVLVAHSLGVIAAAHAAPLLPEGRVRGAFLVAPPSDARLAELAPGVDPAFGPAPRDPLPFPSLLVASRNDWRCSFEEAEDKAYAWGSALVDAGEVGHINVESGHGPWPEGLMRLGAFLAKLT